MHIGLMRMERDHGEFVQSAKWQAGKNCALPAEWSVLAFVYVWRCGNRRGIFGTALMTFLFVFKPPSPIP